MGRHLEVRRMRILFLTTLFPYPPDSGGKIKTLGTLEILSKIGSVDLVCFSEEHIEDNDSWLPMVNTQTVEIIPVTSMKNIGFAIRRLLSGLLLKEPYIIRKFHSRSLANKVNNLLKNVGYDLIYVDHLAMAQYVMDKRFVLDEHNYETELFYRRSIDSTNIIASVLYRHQGSLLRQYELDVCNRAQRIFTISSRDKQSLESIGVTTPIEVLPVYISSEWPKYVDTQGTPRVLLIGSVYWEENFRGAQWFIEKIYPLLDPGVNVRIAGKGANERLGRYIGSIPLELVDDFSSLADVTSGCNVVVIPVQSGGGIRIKTIQALKGGYPVVSTPTGAEGIDGLQNGRHIRIEESPKQFASAINELLASREYRISMSNAAREWGQSFYTEENATKVLKQVLDV
jgi:glycosyltransferase involved in cell wall biosynthesis